MRAKTGIFKKCLTCKKDFYVHQCEIKTKKYCSWNCGKIHLYQNGHLPWNTGRKRPEISKENHYNWKGGKCIDPRGYIKIHKPEHPYCDDYGYVYEHRLIIENKIKRYLKPDEIVHHKNNNRGDNSIYNLCILTNGEHMRKHIKTYWKKWKLNVGSAENKPI